MQTNNKPWEVLLGNIHTIYWEMIIISFRIGALDARHAISEWKGFVFGGEEGNGGSVSIKTEIEVISGYFLCNQYSESVDSNIYLITTIKN